MDAQLWQARCSEALHQQWSRISPAQRDEVAMELWQAERWRAMEPEAAVRTWLSQGIPVRESTGHAR